MSSPAGFVLTSRKYQFIGGVVAVLTLVFGCRDPAVLFTQLDDSRGLAADLRVQFNKADDASNRAVMADTDEASVAFARDAETAVGVVESDATALAPLLRSLGFSNEIRTLQEFGTHFTEYRNLDRAILTLAVENTNLKAQSLSFGPARHAADSFRDSLATIASAIAPKDRCRAEGLVAKAVLAVREIQVLQAPHIAESDDAAMTQMEKDMAGLDATARDAMKALGEIVQPDVRPVLAAALAALDQFKGISAQIVTLSRRNSNVRSLELSLRKKPALVTACDDTLRALQDALAKEGSKATR